LNTIIEKIQGLLAHKAKADALPAETKLKYVEAYNQVVAGIAGHYLDFLMLDNFNFVNTPDIDPLITWDYEINSEILSITLKDMAQKYENKKAYVEWMCKSLIPEVDVSFREKDQGRFGKCIQAAMQQIKNV